MDLIFGDKALSNPLAIATSEGPMNSSQELASTSSTISCSNVKSPQWKRRQMEHVLEEFVENIEKEKDERRKKEAKYQKMREQNRLDRERRHKEQIDVQKSLVSI
ncbi:uncharacterized protein LOC120358526 [Solenopsis invicta]|uniref:uncharacterized protein LOC120358526 n=1 Tax=Solenopsis invicta TaxID=13686 RepID=UPI00193DBB0F|nr:uncharacterized protein LOC120358526 [Solenopsis invicta]